MSARLDESRFWKTLWRVYPRAPSLVLCRVPELELAARAELPAPILDHCCGDGLFASLAWPERLLEAGCDLASVSLAAARRRGNYRRLDECDAARRLPYADASFASVFDNSALEHLADLPRAISEIARVLRPGGRLQFNVLNRRFFEWWPGAAEGREAYRAWQPFPHALTLAEWEERLRQAGLRIESVRGYFGREAARVLARLDYEFSGAALGRRFSALAWSFRLAPCLVRPAWRRRLGELEWETPPDAGAGFSFEARRDGG